MNYINFFRFMINAQTLNPWEDLMKIRYAHYSSKGPEGTKGLI